MFRLTKNDVAPNKYDSLLDYASLIEAPNVPKQHVYRSHMIRDEVLEVSAVVFVQSSIVCACYVVDSWIYNIKAHAGSDIKRCS